MKVLAVVLARGGSTRLPGKNLAKLGGLSLVAHAVRAAKQAKLVDEVVISTQDNEIAAEGKQHGAIVVFRPESLSGPHAKIEDALRHALLSREAETCSKFTHVVGLQAACPVRPFGAIDDMLNAMEDSGHRGAVTMVRRSPWNWTRDHKGDLNGWWDPTDYPRSQDIKDQFFEEVNSIQIGLREEVIKGHRWASPLVVGVLPKGCDIDIDDKRDLEKAQILWPAIQDILSGGLDGMVWSKVPVSELHEKRWVGPCTTNCFRKKHIGVVFGNGPQIDSLPEEVFKVLAAPKFISCGVNRVASSIRFREANFWPNIHLIWDKPDSPPKEEQKLRKVGLWTMRGKTWRVAQATDGMDFYPTDQFLKVSVEDTGTIEDGVRMRTNSCDAAVNLLYRMGIREVYLFGVEMNCNQHFNLMGQVGQDTGIWNQEVCVKNALNYWKVAQQATPDLRLFCSCSTSRLVKDAVVPYGVPPGLENFSF